MTEPSGILSSRWVFLAVATAAIAVRLIGIGQVLTPDEELWMIRGGEFMDALRSGDLKETFHGTHPGVTLMVLAGVSIRAQETLTGTSFEKEENVGEFFLPAKILVAIVTALLLGVIAVLLKQLGGTPLALIGGGLLAFDPFLLGHSQLIHLDALLSLLMLASVLSFAGFVTSGTRRVLLLSAVLAGLAFLTKLPALFLLVAIPFAVLLFRERWSVRMTPRAMGGLLALWLLVAVLVFLLWPAMWVRFRRTLWYINRDATTVVNEPHFTESDVSSSSPLFYPRAVAQHASPAILLLAGGSMVFLFRRRSGPFERRLVLLWIVYGAGFIAALSFLEKRSDRYILPAHLAVVLLAAFSLAALWSSARGRAVVRSLAVLVIGGTAVTSILLAPHALAFRNTFVPGRELSQEGWGEGLEEAAAILNAHPLAEELEVATWYPRVFRHFFRGKTFSLSSRDDPRMDYVVLYRNMRGRGPDDPATEIVREYAEREPDHTVRVLGEPYAWIYRTDSVDLFPSHVGELRAGMEVGQRIPVRENGWSGVRVVFATFSSRANTVDVVLHVRESPDAASDIRTARVNARDLEDGAWHTFSFAPIPDSAGKTYDVFLTSPEGRAGNAVTVRFQERDILPGEMILLRRPLRTGESRDRFVRGGDLGYAVRYAKPETPSSLRMHEVP